MEKKFKAYNGDQAFKEKFLSILQAHQNGDLLRQGTYGTAWDPEPEGRRAWKGCAVACSMRSLHFLEAGYSKAEIGMDVFTGTYCSHAAVAERLCIPEELVLLQDAMFEALPREWSISWPARFCEAIQPGADLSKVYPAFGLAMLKNVNAKRIRHQLVQLNAMYEELLAGAPTFEIRRKYGLPVKTAEHLDYKEASRDTREEEADLAGLVLPLLHALRRLIRLGENSKQRPDDLLIHLIQSKGL